jgi:hypothetical protein
VRGHGEDSTIKDGGGSFTDLGAGLPGVRNSCVAWGDYDNDGDLDILLTGDTGSGFISCVYRNLEPTPRTPPGAPANLATTPTGEGAILSWDAAADGQTPAAGLTNNLRVGTAPGAADVVPGMANPTSGWR